MLKQFIVFILLACVVSTYLSRDFAVVSFELNQKYISEKLCENRDKPWMHCNGRCYLMKKVKQAEDNEKRQANKDLRSSMQVLWCVNPSNLIQNRQVEHALAKRYKIHYSYAYSNQYTTAIFRPPKSLSIA